MSRSTTRSSRAPCSAPCSQPTRAPSSALLTRVDEGCCVVEWAVAGVACAGHDDEQGLQEPEDGGEGQAGASAFGSRRNWGQKAWAGTVRGTGGGPAMELRRSEWVVAGAGF